MESNISCFIQRLSKQNKVCAIRFIEFLISLEICVKLLESLAFKGQWSGHIGSYLSMAALHL